MAACLLLIGHARKVAATDNKTSFTRKESGSLRKGEPIGRGKKKKLVAPSLLLKKKPEIYIIS